jgi:hypothetical protein
LHHSLTIVEKRKSLGKDPLLRSMVSQEELDQSFLESSLEPDPPTFDYHPTVDDHTFSGNRDRMFLVDHRNPTKCKIVLRTYKTPAIDEQMAQVAKVIDRYFVTSKSAYVGQMAPIFVRAGKDDWVFTGLDTIEIEDPRAVKEPTPPPSPKSMVYKLMTRNQTRVMTQQNYNLFLENVMSHTPIAEEPGSPFVLHVGDTPQRRRKAGTHKRFSHSTDSAFDNITKSLANLEIK